MKMCTLDMVMLNTYVEKLEYFMQLSDANLFYLAIYLNKCFRNTTFKLYNLCIMLNCTMHSTIFCHIYCFIKHFVYYFIYVQEVA